MRNAGKITSELFAKIAGEKHNGFYDYSKTIYINNRTPIIITCPKHGDFVQLPKTHLRGSGCKKCGIRKLNLTTDEFINRALSVHGSVYIYDNVNYIDSITPVSITCKKHGIFKQEPRYHLRGHGCKLCANEQLSSSKTSRHDFITKASNVHNGKYDYDLDEFVKLSELITIKCPIHGEYEQTAINHISGKGCYKCGVSVVSVANKYTVDIFKKLAIEKHNHKYVYDKVLYVNSTTKVCITCPLHGDFWQTPSEHLRGSGCRSCSTTISAGHEEICNFIDCNYIVNDRSCIAPYEIDIYIPERRLGIEFHGGYWHSYAHLESKDQIYYHSLKHDLAINAGINLLQFYDFEWKYKTNIVKSIINHYLNRSERLYARDCIIKETDCNYFFDQSHLYGNRYAKYQYGLFNNDELVAAISLSNNGKFLEIIRYANKLNTTVVGGFSKLLSYISKKFDKPLLTFADRRISTGMVYRQMKFEFVKVTAPNYCYLYRDGSYAFSRHQCQKNKLNKLLGGGFNDELSESQNMFSNGYRRLWDAGHYKYIKNL